MTLPFAGLGLSASLNEAVVLCERRLAGDPIPASLDYLNVGFQSGDRVPSQLPRLLEKAGLSVVLHAVNLNLSTEVGSDFITELKGCSQQLDADWVEEDLGVWMWDQLYLGYHLLNPVLDQPSVENTVREVKRCQRLLGRPVLVENPPVYYCEGDLDMWEYMVRIAEGADCSLVLDIGHMIGWALNTDRPVELAPPEWRGWARVREFHLSGFTVITARGRARWLDVHSRLLNPESLTWLNLALQRVQDQCSVCLELEGASPEVIASNIKCVQEVIEH